MAAGSEPSELAALTQAFPMPGGWTLSEHLLERPEIGEARPHLVGLLARGPDGADATGSAAELERYPLERAYFELLERITLLDAIRSARGRFGVRSARGARLGSCARSRVFPTSPAGADWSYSRSNGVAAAGTWADACEAALLELVERDRVLRSWYGETRPQPLAGPAAGVLSGLAAEYACEYRAFPGAARGDDDASLSVIGVFAFPRRASAPFAYGLGAARSPERARRKAERECLQGIGFLWGEPLPDRPPELTPTPSYHQESYLLPAMQQRLRAWLGGEHFTAQGVLVAGAPRAARRRERYFVDLTPKHLRGRLAIAKALGEAELALTFGRTHPRVKPAVAAGFAPHPLA